MELVEICYGGSENYLTEDEPLSGKPPPSNRNISQLERMQLIIALIRENQNRDGANIELVISKATEQGIDIDQILNDIEYLKSRGDIYEYRTGRIRSTL